MGRALKEKEVERDQGDKSIRPAEGKRLSKGLESGKPNRFRGWGHVPGWRKEVER